jgi:CheY-like chemotaxis protein
MHPSSPYILIADDDPDDQEMFADRWRLHNSEAEVECVSSGTEALSYLRNCPSDRLPRLIVIDYKMPGITGDEVLRLLLDDDRYARIPKIVWSSSNNKEYIDLSLQSGAQRYFTKPADMPAFDHMIEEISRLFRGRTDGA